MQFKTTIRALAATTPSVGARRGDAPRLVLVIGLALTALLALTPAQSQAQGSYVDEAHAKAVAAFRKARFAEAYGRFVELADLGHPASARYALWMCEQGPTLFDTHWACEPEQVSDWTQAARFVEPPARRVSAPVQNARPATPVRK